MPRYAFGPFFLDPADRRLTRGGRRVAVPAKAWQILLLMVEAGGRLVPHEAFRAKLRPESSQLLHLLEPGRVTGAAAD